MIEEVPPIDPVSLNVTVLLFGMNEPLLTQLPLTVRLLVPLIVNDALLLRVRFLETAPAPLI